MSIQGSLNQALGTAAVLKQLNPKTRLKAEEEQRAKETREYKRKLEAQEEASLADFDVEMTTGEYRPKAVKEQQLSDIASIYKRLADLNPSERGYTTYYDYLERLHETQSQSEEEYIKGAERWKSFVQSFGEADKNAQATTSAMDKLNATTGGWIRRNPQTGKFQAMTKEDE